MILIPISFIINLSGLNIRLKRIFLNSEIIIFSYFVNNHQNHPKFTSEVLTNHPSELILFF